VAIDEVRHQAPRQPDAWPQELGRPAAATAIVRWPHRRVNSVLLSPVL
jgi:hypothetical protein